MVGQGKGSRVQAKDGPNKGQSKVNKKIILQRHKGHRCMSDLENWFLPLSRFVAFFVF